MKEKETRLDILKSKVEESKYVPSGISTIRALVASIPIVGGALDHLIFDKAEEIKAKNIERSIDDINTKMKLISEDKLEKGWFESTEALEMFKQLIDKVQFESDNKKIKTIADIYAVSGTKEFASDPNKFAVLRKAAELTNVQKEILLIMSEVPRRERKFDNAQFESKGTAIWGDDILKAINSNPKGKFWTGELHVPTEAGILSSLNLVSNVNVMFANVAGFDLTELGRLLVKYIKT